MTEPTTERIRELRDEYASLIVKCGYKPGSGMFKELADSVAICNIALAARGQEPVAWLTSIDDNANVAGWIDAMAWSEGEFTTPVYANPPADQRSEVKIARCEALVQRWNVASEDHTIDRNCREMYGECAEWLTEALRGDK